LDFIGPGKPLSQQQFAAWRNRVDKVYESYVELIGKTPIRGEKVFINLQRGKEFSSPTKTGGHAHGGSNIFCINRDATSFRSILQEVATHGSTSHVMMHEMAHIFERAVKWNVEPTSAENIVEFLISYAMEANQDLYYYNASRKITGEQHRQRRYQGALDKLKANEIEDFSDGVGGSTYSLYLFGLVDKVKWDTYKQVFRSYNDKEFTPNKYRGISPTTRARCFFDRVEHFSGKPDILRTQTVKAATCFPCRLRWCLPNFSFARYEDGFQFSCDFSILFSFRQRLDSILNQHIPHDALRLFHTRQSKRPTSLALLFCT